MLNRQDILKCSNLKKEKITIPEWGGDIFVSEMSGETRDVWEVALLKSHDNNKKNRKALLIVSTVVDEKGKRLFSDDDIEAVGKLSGIVLEKVCTLAIELNGLSVKSLEKSEGN